MNRWKITLFAIPLIVSLNSCMTYQYTGLSSTLPFDASTREYFLAKDSVRISFSFKGKDLPFKTIIHNQSKGDIYLDLLHSIYLENGRVVSSFAHAKSSNHPVVISDISEASDIATAGLPTRATLTGSGLIYIPPGSVIEFTAFPFSAAYDVRKRQGYHSKEPVMMNGTIRKVKRYNLRNEGRELGAIISLSPRADLTNSNRMEVSFREDVVYSTGYIAEHLPDGPNVYYHTEKMETTAGNIIVGILLAGSLAAAISTLAENPE